MNWTFNPYDGGEEYEIWTTHFWPSGDSGGRDNDYDRDGDSNFHEWIAGSNPTNDASVFRIVSIETDGDRVDVRWDPAVSNRLYDLYWSSNLFTSFEIIQQNLFAPPLGNGTFDSDRDGESGFYRVRVKR